jgi:hypothetical protein
MVASYRIDKANAVKHVTISGETSYVELEGLFYKYIRDPNFEPELRILADLRGMTDAISGLWEIQKLKKLYQYAYRDAVGVVDVVIVVNKGIAFRAARAFRMLMRDKKPLNVKITDTIGDAQEMLGLLDHSLSELPRTPQSRKLELVVHEDC